MLLDFENLGLDSQILQAIQKIGFESPTAIQMQTIPALLAGRDVMGQAQTGTGKTAAFMLPILQRIQRNGSVQALILAPTRELAIQVTKAAGLMAQDKNLSLMTVYGGQSYDIQIRQLKQGADVVVGTTGRVMDLIRKGVLDLSQVSYLVLDEADEMLDMGFIEDIETILQKVPSERQTAMFSATLPKEVRRLADQYLSDPLEIMIEAKQRTVAETDQRCCLLKQSNKQSALISFLEMEQVTGALVFARTRASAQRLADDLKTHGYDAEALHGEMPQVKREKVLAAFRKHLINIVVATDVAARGLDIQGLSHVFNFDAPNDADDYLHRVGRTGRAGEKGVAITFFTNKERGLRKSIETFTRQPMTELTVPTREEIIFQREERFMDKVLQVLNEGVTKKDRKMAARLAELPFPIEEITAAALKLARGAEVEVPQFETSEPTAWERDEKPSRKKEYSSRKEFSGKGDNFKSSDSKKKQHRKGQHRERDEEGMVRLKMNLGKEDGIHPNDVVGAIAGETGIPSRAIGRIDIFDKYAFVDVAEQHSADVVKSSDGAYKLRGKPVRLKLAV